jgi:hypothetical protein
VQKIKGSCELTQHQAQAPALEEHLLESHHSQPDHHKNHTLDRQGFHWIHHGLMNQHFCQIFGHVHLSADSQLEADVCPFPSVKLAKYKQIDMN